MKRELIRRARRAWTWVLRVVVSFWLLTGFLPLPLLIVWLEWQNESTDAHHPGKAQALAELAEARERCRA